MLDRMLKNVKSIAIGGHVRPDGDCVGSTLALYTYLKEWYQDVEVDLYLEPYPDSFRFLKYADEIKHESIEKDYDLFITLDCGDISRLGFSEPLFESAKETWCIDHHISNQAFADENEIKPDASSTCEILYLLLEEEKITKEIAECLYLGIVHDTGAFQYSCTAPETMEIAAKLMRKGVNASKIIDETFFKRTYTQLQLLGLALLESITFMDGKCIATAITRKDLRFFEAQNKDLEGIVSELRLTKGVEVAIFMYETENFGFKVSLRSNDLVDVSKVAQYFGGGGHVKAAGCAMNGTFHDVLNNLSAQIELQLKEKGE